VGLGVGSGVGISVGLGVGVAVSVGLADAVGDAPAWVGLGETGDAGTPGPPRRVVDSAARITVPSPLSVAGFATGLRSPDGLGLTCGPGLVSLTATGEEWVTAFGRWRAPK
jgi:hypothetical protein